MAIKSVFLYKRSLKQI